MGKKKRKSNPSQVEQEDKPKQYQSEEDIKNDEKELAHFRDVCICILQIHRFNIHF